MGDKGTGVEVHSRILQGEAAGFAIVVLGIDCS
jgi:hypothetical protein